MLTTRSHELGALLKVARLDAKLSTRQLAEKAGLAASQIVRLEGGKIASPSVNLLTRVAGALDISLASVLDAAGYPMHRPLPHLAPYLRERYPELPEMAVIEMEEYLTKIAREYGLGGPSGREDET